MVKMYYITGVLFLVIILVLTACVPTQPSITPTSNSAPALTRIPTLASLSTTIPTPYSVSTSTPTLTPVLPSATAPTSNYSLNQTLLIESQGLVTRVIDGDTIEIDIAGVKYKVRYLGIDAPEINDKRAEISALAQEATKYNQQLVEGKAIRLERDITEKDEFGRLLRYIYVSDLFVNAELVRTGYAQVEEYPPDVKYQSLFLQLESEAQIAGRGLWATFTSTLTPVNPSVGDSNIQISRIFYDGLVRQVESDEYVEISNTGEQSQNLAGWILKDLSDGYPSFIFPSYVLNPSKSVRVYTNENHPEWGGFSFQYSHAIWNNSVPDTAVLYDSQGKEVSQKSY